jgi:polysaccharide biosynthesis transport protein
VAQLSSLSSILRRRFWTALIAFVSVFGAASAYLLTTTDRYETSVRLIVDEQKTSVSELGRTLSEVPSATPGGANPVATQAELVKSRRILQQALDLLDKKYPNNTSHHYPDIDELARKVQIKIIPATNLLEMSYEYPNPEIAAQVLNAIAETMVQENTEAIRREASSVVDFLEVAVPQQESNLQNAEQQERQFRQSNGLVSSEIQANTLVQSLAEVENELRSTVAQLQQANSRDKMLQRIIGVTSVDRSYAAVRAGQDITLRDLRTKLSDLEAQIAASRSRLGDQHPDLLALYDQRSELQGYYNEQFSRIVGGQPISPNVAATDDVSRDLIAQYITGEVERSALTSKFVTLQVNYKSLQTRLTQLPAQQQQLAILVRQRQAEEDSLKLLQQNLEQARIAEAQLISNVRIVDLAAVPTSPSSPKVLAVLAMAIAVGLMLSVGSVLLLELLDDTLYVSDDFNALFKIPVIGNLPKLLPIGDRQQLKQFLDNTENIEPYRRLLKAIELRHDHPSKVIVVTSTLAGEGKSNVVTRLAAVAAMLSRRTLIIDANLQHPCQHQLLGTLFQPGVVEVTEGSACLDQAIHTTTTLNLSILPCGRLLTCPSMALEATTIKQLMSKVREQFDLVVVDVAPVRESADILTLRQYADGLLLVMRPSFSLKEGIQHTLTDLESGGATIDGLIVNHTPDVSIEITEPRSEYHLQNQLLSTSDTTPVEVNHHSVNSTNNSTLFILHEEGL